MILSLGAVSLSPRAFAVLAGLAMTTASPLRAQNNPAPVDQSPAPGAIAREANIYDYQRHQPTAADLGTAPPPPEAVNREVQKFLKQMDALDRLAEKLDEGR